MGEGARGDRATNEGDGLDWAALSATASTIDERLAGDLDPTGEKGWEETAERHLGLWCQSAAWGDSRRFERRLARDGLSLDAVRSLMGPVRWRDPGRLPNWVETARWLLAAVTDGNGPPAPPPHLAAEVPFADLMWPAVVAARVRRDALLADFAPAVATMVEERALADLDAALLRRFAEIHGQTLFESFAFFRQAGPAPVDGAPAGRGIHAAFVAAMRGGVFATLVRHRPVMIRLLAVIADQWMTASAEMLRRLVEDRAGFAGRFAGLSPAAPVTGFDVGTSDPHDHGRGVAILRFADGGRLVYKPRDLSMEAAWHGLAAWLKRAGAPTELGAANVWRRLGYGWMAFVEGSSELDGEAVAAFFRRAGGLLAVLRWLRASDMHEENIVVRDGVPVPIDLETVLQPNLVLGGMTEPALRAEAAAQDHLDNSVLSVGLLPRRMRIAGRELEVGGLAAPDVVAVPEWRFTAVGRDDMAEERHPVERSTAGLALAAGGASPRIADHAAEVAAGFRDMVAFLARNRRPLFAADGPLAPFADARMRHVLRATAYYEMLRREARRPANQANGVLWSRHFDRLARNVRWDLGDDPGWPVISGERAALGRYDVPLLLGRGGVDGCWIDGQAVAPGLMEPAVWPQLARRLDDLAKAVDEERRIIVQAATANAFPPRARRPWADDGTEFDEGSARAAALSIAELLAERAVRRDGAAAWVGLRLSVDGKGFDLKPMDASLYGGQAGIALFLAACFRATGEEGWRTLALEALMAIRFRLARPDLALDLRAQVGIGGFAGIGSLVYALARSAVLLEAPTLLADAKRVAALIDDRAIAADRVFDVVGGAAGAALGLLALHRASGEGWVLERALECGRRIPSRPWVTAEGAAEDWRGGFQQPLCGLSHGAAGIALALLRLHAAAGDATFLEKARRGIDYERALFDGDCRNWPDLRSEEGVSFPCQWCHGAAGIGLARLAALDVLDDAQVRAEIAAALATVTAWPDADPDHLCCGNAGRLAILDAGGRVLGDAGLRALARRRTAAWLKRAGGIGGFVLPGSDPVFRLGLFQGLPGIGYALLRLGGSDDLPDPLILS